MIYTTYFAKLKSLPKDITPIAICAKLPVGYRGCVYKALAPKYDFYSKWKADKDNDYFSVCYTTQVLNKLNPAQIVFDLYRQAGKDIYEGDIALVCYEKSLDFCHRHLVAGWLRDNGYPCEEFDFNKK